MCLPGCGSHWSQLEQIETGISKQGDATTRPPLDRPQPKHVSRIASWDELMVNRFGINLKMSGHLQIMKVTNYILQCKSQYRNKYAYTVYISKYTYQNIIHMVILLKLKMPRMWWPRFKQPNHGEAEAETKFPTRSQLSYLRCSTPRLHYGLNVSSSQRFSSSACGNSTDARRKTSKFHQHRSHNSELWNVP